MTTTWPAVPETEVPHTRHNSRNINWTSLLVREVKTSGVKRWIKNSFEVMMKTMINTAIKSRPDFCSTFLVTKTHWHGKCICFHWAHLALHLAWLSMSGYLGSMKKKPSICPFSLTQKTRWRRRNNLSLYRKLRLPTPSLMATSIADAMEST